MIGKKKWEIALFEIERSIPNAETIEDYKILLDQFELIDQNYRDLLSPKSYSEMWRVAFLAGKLKLASSYARKLLEHLIEYKRLPQIKKMIKSFHEAGIFKNESKEYLFKTEILEGKEKKVTTSDLLYFEQFSFHPEFWKSSADFLRFHLLLEGHWGINEWKLCYEFILINFFDKDIFKLLLLKTLERNNKKSEKEFLEFFESRKIPTGFIKHKELKAEDVKDRDLTLKIDYDQLAMDLLSGLKKPTDDEQDRILGVLRFITTEELQEKGQEMIVAFELLGMGDVVCFLCEKMIHILKDVKARASIYYTWAHSFLNTGDYYNTIDLVDDVLQKEPLFTEESFALLYLKAEACLKLKKIKLARELYLKISKENPNYRLVKERLRLIEKT